MPIQTNLAVETDLYHVPIPASQADVNRLNACWERQPPKNGRIVAEHTAVGLVLHIKAPVLMLAVSEEYWKEIGRLVRQTGEPWWDFCAAIKDFEPRPDRPHAHALSIYRITPEGELHYLHHEMPEQ
jgi:hypothetical protein